MKQLTTEKGTFMAVEVPSDAYRFRISWKGNALIYKTFQYVRHRIPQGNWQILSTELNEEVAMDVVEQIHLGAWVNYERKTNIKEYNWDFYKDTSLESLHSLLQANGIDHNKKIVLLKKI